MNEYGQWQWTGLALGRSGIRWRILATLFLEREERLHLREIARRVGTSAGTTRRELQRLMDAGIVQATREGNQLYFKVVGKSTLYRSLDEVIRATAGAKSILRRHLEGLPGLESAVIFGSYAASMSGPNSDIDVLIVGQPDRDELTDRLEESAREIGRDVNEIVYTAKELATRRKRRDGLIRSIDEGRTIEILP
jgi:predicted nucleotidyltransferase